MKCGDLQVSRKTNDKQVSRWTSEKEEKLTHYFDTHRYCCITNQTPHLFCSGNNSTPIERLWLLNSFCSFKLIIDCCSKNWITPYKLNLIETGTNLLIERLLAQKIEPLVRNRSRELINILQSCKNSGKLQLPIERITLRDTLLM